MQELQNFMFLMLRDGNIAASKISLVRGNKQLQKNTNQVLRKLIYKLTNEFETMLRMFILITQDIVIDLYHRKIWNNARTANIISTALFSKAPKVSESSED